jgi:hypothetical protein
MKTPQQIRNEVEKEIEELNDLQINEAKLSILTEYDKSIKEMIENMGWYVSPLCREKKLLDKEELLSKIGDVQQSKEKREGLYLSDEQFQKEIMFAKEQTSEEKQDDN